MLVAFAAQRSAQELPQVDKCSLNSCPIGGGEEMVIMGSNFFPESKVIFQEKGPGETLLYIWTDIRYFTPLMDVIYGL